MDWYNHSLPDRIDQNTAINPDWICSSNQTYLSSQVRSFYGFTYDNITESLEGIAHSVSVFAAGSCISNTSCALTYGNDTAQMYYDFRNYVNVTFFDAMTSNLLQNSSMSFCPDSITSTASLFTIPTTYFDGSTQRPRQGIGRL